MSRFWTAAAALLVAGIGLVVFAGGNPGITFSDLETECRYDRVEQHDVTLDDNRLEFEGMFPVSNTDVRLDYSYSRGEMIVLDVHASEMDRPDSFQDECLGVAVYKARTDRIPEGTYDVRVRHDGDLQERMVIEVK